MKIPKTDKEWKGEIPRTFIDVRKSAVVKDALREAKKAKFDTKKLLDVNNISLHIHVHISVIINHRFILCLSQQLILVVLAMSFGVSLVLESMKFTVLETQNVVCSQRTHSSIIFHLKNFKAHGSIMKGNKL